MERSLYGKVSIRKDKPEIKPETTSNHFSQHNHIVIMNLSFRLHKVMLKSPITMEQGGHI